VVALDSSGYYSLFPGKRPPDAFQDLVRGALSGRDVRIPKAMLKELAVNSGLTRADVLRNLRSVAARVEVIPEGAFSTRKALKSAGLVGKKFTFDRRIAASAIDLGEMFGTGDRRQMRAFIDVLSRSMSRDAARAHVVSLSSVDPRNLGVLFALGFGGAAVGSNTPWPVSPQQQ
jgi:hypothetical protein